jgi:hypothetical protein
MAGGLCYVIAGRFVGLTPHPTTPNLWVLPNSAVLSNDGLKTPELGWILGLLSPVTSGHQFVGALPQV